MSVPKTSTIDACWPYLIPEPVSPSDDTRPVLNATLTCRCFICVSLLRIVFNFEFFSVLVMSNE
jgi:hypothetical protein